MTWKKVSNSDSGTATKHGGNDIDKIADAFNGVNVSDPIKYNTDINTLYANTNAAGDLLKSNGTKFVRLARGTANQVLAVNSGGTDVAWATAAGGGSAAIQEYNYLIYINPGDGSYKALNGATGVIDFSHANDFGELLRLIFASVASTVPLSIKVGKGDFRIRSWDESNYRRGLFSLVGQGRGITRFLATDDIENVAADSRVMAFEGVAGSAINFTTNASKGDSFIILASNTGLVVGGYFVIRSDALFDSTFSSAEKSEINRVLSIHDNGGGTWKIMLEKALRDSYATADTARIVKYDYLKNIYLADFTIDWDTGTTNQTMLLSCHNWDGGVVERLELKNARGGFHKGLITTLCQNCHFDDLDFIIEPLDFIEAGPYCISCRSASENLTFSNCRMRGGWRHAFTTTTDTNDTKMGIPRNILVSDCYSETSGECSFDTHGEGDGIWFRNCTVFSSRSGGASGTTVGTEDTDGFNTRCPNVSYENCKVFNNRGNGFAVSANTYNIKILGCHADNLKLNRTAITIATSCHDIIISDCVVSNIDNYGLDIAAGSYNILVDNLNIRNTCRTDNTKSPINIQTGVKNVTLTNIMIDSSNDTSIVPIRTAANCEGIRLDNVTLLGAGTDPVFAGIDIISNPRTCKGRNLSKPLRKEGRFEAVGTSSNTGVLSGQTTAAGGTRRVETTDGLFCEFSSSTLNEVRGIKSNAIVERDLNPYIRFVFRVETTTLMRLFLMWSSDTAAVGPAGTDPLANQSGIGLKLASSGTNFQIYHNSGDATTTTGANIAAVDTNLHTFEIRADNANSKWQYRWDYASTWIDVSTDTPSGGTDLGIQAYMENNETAVAKTTNILEIETSLDNK